AASGRTVCWGRPCSPCSRWSAISSRSCTGAGRIFTPDSRSPWPPSMCWSSGMASSLLPRVSCPSRSPSLVCKRLTSLVQYHFVERNNLTCRQCNGRLSGKVLSFSKDLTWLEKHLWLSFAYYHFVLPHDSLSHPIPEPQLTRGSGS